MIQRFFLLTIVTISCQAAEKSCQAAEKRKSPDYPEEQSPKRTDNKQEYYNTSGRYVLDPNSNNTLNPTKVNNYVLPSPTLTEKLNKFRLANDSTITFDKHI